MQHGMPSRMPARNAGRSQLRETPLRETAWNPVFDLKSTTGSSKLKCYHASSNRRVGG